MKNIFIRPTSENAATVVFLHCFRLFYFRDVYLRFSDVMEAIVILCRHVGSTLHVKKNLELSVEIWQSCARYSQNVHFDWCHTDTVCRNMSSFV